MVNDQRRTKQRIICAAATVVVRSQQMASFRESVRTCPGTETLSRASLCATAQQIVRVMVALGLRGKITQPRIHLSARQSVVRGGSGICGWRMMPPRCCRWCVAGGRRELAALFTMLGRINNPKRTRSSTLTRRPPLPLQLPPKWRVSSFVGTGTFV